VIRLRSIGDTVLATPTLVALRRFLPDARIDILLEDWVAPLLDGFDAVDNVIEVGGGRRGRLKAAWEIRRNRYDVVFNLHGGTTSTFLTFVSGARHRVGYADYQYSFLHTHRSPPAAEFWQQARTHSAEQQLALAGHVGVPVDDRPRSQLAISTSAEALLTEKFHNEGRFALLHPAGLFKTKQWSVDNFASVVDHLARRGLASVAVAGPGERQVLEDLKQASRAPVIVFDELTLPEIIVLASRASLFVGNDSGVAHIAAAVDTPTVVIFGSSNRDHWHPWTDAPYEIVYNEFNCQPCPGYECKVFGEPKCILSVTPDQVTAAIQRVLAV